MKKGKLREIQRETKSPNQAVPKPDPPMDLKERFHFLYFLSQN